MQKYIALFGGAFDPPHLGHLTAIRQIFDAKRFDGVWVVPSGMRPDKQSHASPQDRLAMTRLLVKHGFDTHEPVFVKTHLVDAPDSYPFTIQELEYLKTQHPNTAFTVAIGSDQAQALHQWHNPEKLCALADILVIVRDGRPTTISFPCNTTILDPKDNIWLNISSTELRWRIAHEKPIFGLTLLPIAEFIDNKKLYTKEA
ncbi:MAG: hypothetical protein A2806_03475 [Candidatus Terrybacteria bacterium RIFCSPHIGHO2_01_FULL_48_17]|uniref:Probable nicotinate-nucleotide adenylyltransferase n=1 Tax=Candidatus Terrybacteria bacterium RIFCSPHIGHO2_01_FULL_48_17 TaxID=1802362 RepID=A0A1G2PJ34_9BACT|nr:MAG: hypothetical protein A2806_03475 [Candidatus Terrybacteria bacterium RIFCSPHIGHO2_01_FULL_48_17]OHA53115.1 MAG: hypothetical protein A3A30_01985 [Candidatus Terrybacteria bacterium RIFCSPLOWO2_01_FULL_48_14]